MTSIVMLKSYAYTSKKAPSIWMDPKVLYKPPSDSLTFVRFIVKITQRSLLQTLQKYGHFWTKVQQLSNNSEQCYMLGLRTASKEEYSTQWKLHKKVSGTKHLNGS